MTLRPLILAAALAAMAAPVLAAPKPDAVASTQALEMLKKAISIRTVEGAGQVPVLAAYLKDQLVAGGFDPTDIIIQPVGETAWMTTRYRGTDPKLKPVVILGHLDVVEAKPEDWTRDPFTPVIEDGYIFGRGASDMKDEVAVTTAAFIQLKKHGWKPRRDVILAFTGDEETSMASTRALAATLKNAELVLNADSGGGSLAPDGKPLLYQLQAAEKTYADFTLTVTDAGGHSSRPTATNAIYRLAAALQRLSAYSFPATKSELTTAYFKGMAPQTPGPLGEAMKAYVVDPDDPAAIAALSAEPGYVGKLRTTCVATEVNAGHARNALPQRATANINCRILPGVGVEAVRKTLTQVIVDPTVAVAFIDTGTVESPASPLRPDVVAAVTAAVHAQWPGVPITPSMSAGATDSMHFRALGIPSYGVSGAFTKTGDNFAHGLNERLPVPALDHSLVQWDLLLRALAK